jgi:hypothetical protein
MSDLLHTASEVLMPLATDVFDPSKGGGAEPPGAGSLKKILRWVFKGVTLLLVGGVLFVAGKMAISFRHGEGAESVKSLGVVLGACVLASAASGLVSELI